MYRPVNY